MTTAIRNSKPDLATIIGNAVGSAVQEHFDDSVTNIRTALTNIKPKTVTNGGDGKGRHDYLIPAASDDEAAEIKQWAANGAFDGSGKRQKPMSTPKAAMNGFKLPKVEHKAPEGE